METKSEISTPLNHILLTSMYLTFIVLDLELDTLTKIFLQVGVTR